MRIYYLEYNREAVYNNRVRTNMEFYNVHTHRVSNCFSLDIHRPIKYFRTLNEILL